MHASIVYETLIYEVEDEICVITLNRPDRMNAYTTLMGVEVGQALANADDDDGIRAVVITGAGRVFCAGADLDHSDVNLGRVERSPDLTPPSWWQHPSGTAQGGRRLLHPFEVRKPVIAAINGHAVGAGMTLAMLCDIRYSSDDAKLGFPFAARGLIPDLMAHWTVPRAIGSGLALELFFTSRLVRGHEAMAMGLVNRVFHADQVLSSARELASEIARTSAPASVALSKELVWQSLELPLAVTRAKERDQFNAVARLPDAVEGVESFLQKRPPVWTGVVSIDAPPSTLL